MEQKPAVSSDSNVKIEKDEPGIIFENVSFAYPHKKHNVLSNISFTVDSGETVALVGASGVGKSTILKMLLRFYEPTEGKIYLNNYAVDEVDLQSLRERISVVFQEALIFDGSVRENIAYGKPDATDEEIINAAKKAEAHEFIKKMSEGYDTNVGQKGRNLSG